MEFLQKTFMDNNPVFAGGLGLGIMAAGLQMLRSGSQFGIVLLKRQFLVTLEVTSKDRAYPWVLQWLTAYGKRSQHLSVETALRPISSGNRTVFGFVPGPGQHFIQYKGSFIVVQRFREQQMVDLNTGKPWEKVMFTALGTNTQKLESILQESYEFASLQEEGKTIVYTNWGSEWRPFGLPRNRRPLSSVILDRGLAESILSDVLEWKCSSQWYLDRGIPYRRGYLLHGPPGSGKSSFIMALAGHLGYNICILNLAERGLTDDRLALALSCVPPQSIVLLEDIDAAFPKRTAGNAAASSSYHSSDVTFSGLLNVLDGVASSEERLIFMTTNYIEHLDAALIRPGRVDVQHCVGNASEHQIRNMFVKFFDEQASLSEMEVMAERFVVAIRRSVQPLSMAALQGYLLCHKGNPVGAIEGCSLFLEKIAAQSTRTSVHNEASPPVDNNPNKIKTRPVRRLTVDEIDKMPFNPQPGWDNNLQ